MPSAYSLAGQKREESGVSASSVSYTPLDVYKSQVLSHCGSFVSIRGGDQMPALVRREASRPLRVFLQTGQNDLDVVFGHWLNANRELALALECQGYDSRLVLGAGAHSLQHAGALSPATLRSVSYTPLSSSLQ